LQDHFAPVSRAASENAAQKLNGRNLTNAVETEVNGKTFLKPDCDLTIEQIASLSGLTERRCRERINTTGGIDEYIKTRAYGRKFYPAKIIAKIFPESVFIRHLRKTRKK
jgi:hypothetical protein